MRRQNQDKMKTRISNSISQKSRRNPSIIIPKNSKDIRSTRVASQGKFQPADQISSISSFPPPLTPQVQIVAE